MIQSGEARAARHAHAETFIGSFLGLGARAAAGNPLPTGHEAWPAGPPLSLRRK